jgi:hypothetical protein
MLRPTLLIAALVALSFVSPLAAAAEWVSLGVDAEGNLWFVDKASIIRQQGIVRAWKKIEFKRSRPYPPNGQPIALALFLDVTDCPRRLVGVKASKLLRADGTVITAHEDAEANIQWQSVAPDTIVEKSMKFVCAPSIEPKR